MSLDPSKQQLILAEERTELAAQRNKMANERTFLAWARTGLGTVGGGMAVMRLLTFHTPLHQRVAEIVGLLFILCGIAIFICALVEYNKAFKSLRLSNSPVGSPLQATILVSILVILSLALLTISLF